MKINHLIKKNKVIAITILFVVVLELLILSGFQGFSRAKSDAPEKQAVSSISQSDNCIPQEVSGAIPIIQVSERGSDKYRLENKQISPVKPWQLVTSVPKSGNTQNLFFGKILLTRTFNNHHEIWLSGEYSITAPNFSPTPSSSLLPDKSEYNQNNKLEYKILIYDATEKTWTQVDRKIANSSAYIFEVFTDNSGFIWGLGSKDPTRQDGKEWGKGSYDQGNENPEEAIILAKFADEKQQFVLPSENERPAIRYIPEKLIDLNGNYWFFTPNILNIRISFIVTI